jgi:ankyrin repeat protein
LVKLLLNKGLDVNKKGQGGDTPLHNAVVYNRLSMVKLLLDHGADLSITNDHNQTPLDIAVEEEYSKIVDYITSYERIDIKEPEFD